MKNRIARMEHLKLMYGKVMAIQNVSFELYAGEILAIIGPNGSGKTSTIECLEGLRKPTDGKIELFGLQPDRNRRKIYQEMGIQLQNSSYPYKIKVKELCEMFAAFYEQPADWKTLTQQLGLSEKWNRYVDKLSGGEKQRLSILLALLPKPKLLILDELTTGLDPEVRRGMWESLKHIQKMGTTILLVSHYMDEVAYLADRLVYLENGCSSFAGTQEEFRIYAKGRTPAAQWRDGLSLEEIYLLLSPKAKSIDWEGIL